MASDGGRSPPVDYDGYPDHVTQSKCLECKELFYHRYHAEHCPYCGASNDDVDGINILNQGNGVVCNRPPERDDQ